MLVLLSLKKTVVVTALGEIPVIVITAVITDLLGAGPHSVFVVGNQLGVLGLFMLIELDCSVRLG